MLSKEECLKKAKELSYGWHIGNNEFVPLKDVNKLIREIYSIKPYKFEDLQTEMQVYDNYLKECIEISVMCGRNIANHTVTFFRWGQEELEVVKFEDNRFYPVHIAK